MERRASLLKYEVPIWEKSNLTLEEAAAYSGIGINKLRKLSDSESCPFVLWVGSKRLIKRRKLDEYVERIVNASASLYRYAGTTGTTTIEVHKVQDTWTSSGITWANKPTHDSTVEDFAQVDGTGRYYWDVTDIARQWYEDENTGMMFKATEAVEAGNTNDWKKFYSIDYSIYATDWWPYLSITYRNNTGLESYWDYTANGAGRAGTGYVNDYSGNLVWVRDDIGFGGSRMPVSISHIYNSNDSTSNKFGMDYGWKTNFNQTVTAVDDTSASYVWEDGDGTKHYFIYDSEESCYKDEDGLELTLTVTGSGTTITDKNGNTSQFDTAGRLVKQENNQQTKSSINITYTTTTGYLISQITDGVGRVYRFVYDSNGLLSQITYTGTGLTEISSVSYTYSGSLLTQITDKDGESSVYSYTGDNLLSGAQDVDGYRLAYTYTSGSPKRVASINEYQGTDTPGGSLTIAYTHNQTVFTDHNGNAQIMQFNDWGNTISIQDGEGRAQYAQYALNKHDDTADAGQNEKSNQMLLSSKLQNTVSNFQVDHNFEAGIAWDRITTDVTSAVSTDTSYFGSKSLKIVRSASGAASGVYGIPCTILSGDTLAFSAYVKTGEGATAYLAFGTIDGTVLSSSEVLEANSDWTRLEVSYTHQGDEVTIYPQLQTTTAGTIYMDCAQLECMPTASRYNLLEHGDSWGDETGILPIWTLSSGMSSHDGIALTEDVAAPNMDISVLKITGDPQEEKYVSQTLNLGGAEGDCYVFAGWARGNSVPITDEDRAFGLKLIFNNTDGSTTEAYVSFNTDLPADGNWQYASAAAVADKAYSSITMQVLYNYGANTVYFDGIQLFKEEFGSSYTYDSDGNVISVVNLQGQKTQYEYTNNNLTKQIDPNGSELTYTYDSYHNVLTATTAEGVVYGFEYDTYGNNTAVKILANDTWISWTAAYTSDGNRLLTSTDDMGNTTTYSYNENTNVLEWVQYPNDTESSRTTYSYDTMYRLASASANVSGLSSGTALTASYTYDNDMLTEIETGSTTYSFSYGDFAQRSSVKIGSRTLATYTYTDDRNRYLDTMSYGNGDSVSYTYDDLGRVTKQTYEDGSTVSCSYDNTGALATVTDSATGRKTTYYYDLTDRLMKYVETGSNYRHSVGYEYDTLNNLSLLVETINGVEHTTQYAYDDNNRLTFSRTGDVYESVTYDSFGRVTRTLNPAITTRITYNGNSSQVSRYVNRTSGAYLGHIYTYDDNGNILSMSYLDRTITYEYDSANQLTRENNSISMKSTVWTYDDAGNILSRTEYAYTTGELGEPLDTVTYTYGDSEWGDLLTAYDGNTITYDGIGNPLSDGTRTYTWEHGRELKTLTEDGVTWTYSYDANGMRTGRKNDNMSFRYVYDGDRLVQMDMEGIVIFFTYGSSGPISMTCEGEIYYYATNLQGDVVAITDSEGNVVVVYGYDAWGNVVYRSGSQADWIGVLNPFLYRGYTYDIQTNLYYLGSRYYDPEIGRFINADAFTSTGQGIIGNNMFTYCLNDPVCRVDARGTNSALLTQGGMGSEFMTLGGGGIGAAIVGLTVAVIAASSKPKVSIQHEEIAEQSTSITSPNRIYSVYFLYAVGDPTQTIVYVGRVKTANLGARMAYHSAKGRALAGKIDGLTYEECRAFEQAGMVYYHTIGKGKPLYNQIRGISPTNYRLPNYIQAAMDLAGSSNYPDNTFLPISYWENFSENEFLNMGG